MRMSKILEETSARRYIEKKTTEVMYNIHAHKACSGFNFDVVGAGWHVYRATRVRL